MLLTKREGQESVSACDVSVLVQPSSGVKPLGLREDGGVAVYAPNVRQHNGVPRDCVACELEGSIYTVRKPEKC